MLTIMKKYFIKDCKKDLYIDGDAFAIYDLKRAEDKNGKPYYDLLIGDKTGRLKAKIWSDVLSKTDTSILKTSNLIFITGRVDEFKGNLQININSLKLADSDAQDDFVATTEYDIDEMFDELMLEVDAITNNDIRLVLKKILSDKEIQSKYKTWPAASSIHHAFRGGLLQHVLEMLTISKSMKRFYPDVDYNVLTAGVILHDIGKIEEMDASGLTTQYTTKGSLMGHISIGLLIFDRFAAKDLPEEYYLHIANLILSHHGKLDMGSPVLPATVEAQMLTYIDNLSSKPRTALTYIQDLPDEEEFTNFIHWLEGVRLWKGPKHLEAIGLGNILNEDDDADDSGQIPLV